ncbi:MAG: TIGR04282 family arsenosugar biosynthesis glycosyltransferase [Thermodesulfovibrionia bacterium]
MKKALIVFAKTPVKGRIKTRLQPHLTPEKILNLYKSFITETMSRCLRLKDAEIFLGSYPTKDNDFMKELTKKHNIKSFNQRGKNLGERFVNAFKDRFKQGYGKVVIIGSDSPLIPVENIKKAFLKLTKNEFVLGPSCDGGYYLVGASKVIPEVFYNIPWDTGRVLNRTLGKLNSLDIRFSLLPFWYDIDTIEDLRFFRNHLKYLKREGLM